MSVDCLIRVDIATLVLTLGRKRKENVFVAFEVFAMTRKRYKSPHPALQTILCRLAGSYPQFQRRPAFGTRDEAKQFVDDLKKREGSDCHVHPVWLLNHGDLDKSAVVAWSVTDRVN